MSHLAERLIREPGTENAREFGERVYRLAFAYVGLFAGSLVAIALLVLRGQFWVGLAQRSNVETLTLLFLVVFSAYLAVLSTPGALGAVRLAYYLALPRLGHDRDEVERRKAAAIGRQRDDPPCVAVNLILEREDLPRQPFALEVRDRAGPVGTLRVDGAQITHHPTLHTGSNQLIAFFVHQVRGLCTEHGHETELDIVEWRRLDDEATVQYLSLVRFARNLERHLDAPELWPKLVLTRDDCAKLERCLAAVCPAVRNEAFLPDWEYSGEHKLPLIPEPLGLISLSRTEKRVDPVSSMGCAVLVLGAILAVLALFLIFPPWVPG